MAYPVRCRAPREDGSPCNAYAGRVPWPYRVRVICHSDEADPTAHVHPCSSCGALHEIKPAHNSTDGTGKVA